MAIAVEFILSLLLLSATVRSEDPVWYTSDNETHLSQCTEYHERKDTPLVCKDIIDVALEPPVQADLVRLKLKSNVTLCEVEIIAVVCKLPNVPNGGTHGEANTLPGSSLTLKCNAGYFTKSLTSMCTAHGTWDPQPRCTKACTVPPFLNGKYTYANSEALVIGSVVRLLVDSAIIPQCDDGYYLQINKSRSCLANDKWSGEHSKCIPITCKMNENGDLSGATPLCEIGRCNSFGPLSNGTLRYQNNTLTSKKVFDYKTSEFNLSVCDNGFELRGSAERTCLENGTWSGITPICEKIRCTNQTILTDLFQQIRKELLFGDEFIANYNSEHFHLVNGSLNVFCAADGSLRWATQQPFLASICKVQNNGHFRAKTRECLLDDKCEVGKTITFECKEDYQMMRTNSTCLPNHTWSSEPICTPLSQPTPNGAIIVGSAAVGVAVIAIVIAVLLFLHRRKLRQSKTKTRYEKADEPKEELNVYAEYSETHNTDRKKVEDSAECAHASNTIAVGKDEYAANPSDQSYYSFKSSNTMPVTAIKVDDLYDVVLGSEHGVTMKKQFQDFPKGLKDDYSAAIQIQNKPKNRYKHIYPYDDTRVILPTDERHSDYINASFIHGYNKTRAFIASQGPTDEMLVDFWRMAWHLGCGKIVMLTNLEEEKKMKCVQYWPDDECKEYEDFLITNRGTEYFSDFIIRKLSIQKSFFKSFHTYGEERKLIHFHFTAWQDKSVPTYASSLVHFRHKVETAIVKENGPVIVHCSTGVGRTGTFIALNVLSEQAATEGYVDPVGCVSNLRKQRVDMVQTAEQYIFLHLALLETLMLSTSALPSSRFLEAYDELLAFDKTQRTREIDVEFSRMKKMSPVIDECQYVSAKELRNRNKNRYSNILPAAEQMPYLTPSGKRSEPEYINAVFLPEDEVYWPENEDSEIYENMTITKTGQTRKIQQIQFEGWPDVSALPSSPKDVLNLYDAVQYWQHQSGNNPVLVHCMNGADRSGLFCVASAVLERLKIEQDVAITQVIKEMRNYREQIIPSVDQFQFVHEVVKEYILLNETYSNFTN
ncbi:PTPRT-like protein [Mya arenaria]|uniref:protein-tyrosine-phosphatase n=1 Tax=Mya arenaria TaxID=6604 RepID=A0ABY7FUN5_MYAAR|nr:PTPRT-like protein [Mya arenaria]